MKGRGRVRRLSENNWQRATRRGLLRFVLYVGPLLAAVAPLTLAAAIDPGWWTTIYVALLFVIVGPLTGYVVEPLLYGHSTGLSPRSVIVSAPQVTVR